MAKRTGSTGSTGSSTDAAAAERAPLDVIAYKAVHVNRENGAYADGDAIGASSYSEPKTADYVRAQLEARFGGLVATWRDEAGQVTGFALRDETAPLGKASGTTTFGRDTLVLLVRRPAVADELTRAGFAAKAVGPAATDTPVARPAATKEPAAKRGGTKPAPSPAVAGATAVSAIAGPDVATRTEYARLVAVRARAAKAWKQAKAAGEPGEGRRQATIGREAAEAIQALEAQWPALTEPTTYAAPAAAAAVRPDPERGASARRRR